MSASASAGAAAAGAVRCQGGVQRHGVGGVVLLALPPAHHAWLSVRGTPQAGTPIARLAVQFATSVARPEAADDGRGVHVTLMGTKSLSRLRTNVAAVTEPLPPAQYEEALRAVLAVSKAAEVRADAENASHSKRFAALTS